MDVLISMLRKKESRSLTHRESKRRVKEINYSLTHTNTRTRTHTHIHTYFGSQLENCFGMQEHEMEILHQMNGEKE